jgi:hypothetical protein
MADLFRSRFQTPTYREQPSHLRFKRRGVPIAIISYPTLFSSFFGAGGNGAMDILSHPNSAPFDNSQEVVPDIYNPIRPLNPLYQSLGCLS